MKRHFLVDVITTIRAGADLTEQVAHAVKRGTVSLRSICDDAIVIHEVVSPLFSRFQSK